MRIYLKKINQKKLLEYQDKLDLFLDALKRNKEESKNEELYFLISLFAKVYQKKMCELLIQIFYDMNVKIGKEKKENNNNSDRDEKLGEQYNSLMVKIKEETENLIKANGYGPIHFYGLLIYYLNFYDYQTYEST